MKTSALLDLQEKILRHRVAGSNLTISPDTVLGMINEILEYRARGVEIKIAEEMAGNEMRVHEILSLSELGSLSYSEIAMGPEDEIKKPVLRSKRRR